MSAGGQAFVRHAPRTSALIAAAVGVAVLFGWALGIEGLTSVFPGLVSMKVNTAACFVLAGGALWARALSAPTSFWSRIALAAGIAVGAVALATIAEYAVSVDLGIDQLVLSDRENATGTSHPGRMGLNTALALLLVALALIVRRRANAGRNAVADACATLVFVLALIPFLGYAYGAQSLISFGDATQMAFHTSVVLLLLAAGTLSLTPLGPMATIFVSAGPGGALVRRLIPTYTAAIMAVGWLRLLSQKLGLFGTNVGLAALIGSHILLVIAAAGWIAAALDRQAARRRAAEIALERSQARYRAIIDATFDGVLVAEDGVIREANSGIARMFGYDGSAMHGMPVRELIDDGSASGFAERMRSGSEGTDEFVGRRKDGSLIIVESVLKIQDEGASHLLVAAMRDITVQRRLERQMRQVQKMEAVGQLAGGVAHDFNNLLTVITGYSEIMLSDLPAGDRRRDDLEEIRSAAESAASLTRQLLAFSRLQVLEPKVINLNTVVTDLERMLARLIGEDITLHTRLAPDLHRVKADPGQVEQVIVNLVINARDAMPSGGSLTIETVNADMDTSSTSEYSVVKAGNYVMLSVTDTGLGMTEEVRQRVFEPFFTTKGVGKGTGLGLSTVYGIVKQSDGYVWVYSEPGKGTTFKVYFPATAAPADAPRLSSPALITLRGTETVLLAEDAGGVRSLVRGLLREHGYTVIDTPDGPAALAAAAAHNGAIDMLLSDMVMPRMSGRQLANALVEQRPGTRVLFMSGYTNHALVQSDLLGPGEALIQKPFAPEALLRKIREVLANGAG